MKKIVFSTLITLCVTNLMAQQGVIRTAWVNTYDTVSKHHADGAIQVQHADKSLVYYEVLAVWDTKSAAAWKKYQAVPNHWLTNLDPYNPAYGTKSVWPSFKPGDSILVKDGFIYHKDHTFKIYKTH